MKLPLTLETPKLTWAYHITEWLWCSWYELRSQWVHWQQQAVTQPYRWQCRKAYSSAPHSLTNTSTYWSWPCTYCKVTWVHWWTKLGGAGRKASSRRIRGCLATGTFRRDADWPWTSAPGTWTRRWGARRWMRPGGPRPDVAGLLVALRRPVGRPWLAR